MGSPKGAKAKADKYFSLIIRSRGACERCGESRGVQLQTAHIMSRRFSNTRCVEANAFCLCAGCHHEFTDDPVNFGLFVKAKIGSDLYFDLRAQAHKPAKVDWFTVAAELKARWETIEAAA